MEKLSLADNQLTGGIPLSFTSLSLLHTFYFYTTSLCEPPDASYQTWKAGITTYNGTWTVCPIVATTAYTRSTWFYDGDITERGENAGTGGSYTRVGNTFSVGDTALDQQVVGLLHFNTGAIPDDATIDDVTLRLRLESVTGTDPRSLLSYLIVDIAQPYFGTSASLLATDFQAAPDMKVVCTLGVQGAGWFICHLKAAALQHINKTGFTQFKLRFLVGDNDNGIADLMNFYAGDSGVLPWRPLLSVTYTPAVP